MFLHCRGRNLFYIHAKSSPSGRQKACLTIFTIKAVAPRGIVRNYNNATSASRSCRAVQTVVAQTNAAVVF